MDDLVRDRRVGVVADFSAARDRQVRVHLGIVRLHEAAGEPGCRPGNAGCCKNVAASAGSTERPRRRRSSSSARRDGRLERRAADARAAADAGGDDRDPDLAGQPVVDGGAEDDVRVLGRGGADRLRGLVHLDQRHVVAAGDREQDPGRAGDLLVDQRRAQRALRGFLRAVLAARGEADAHQRGAASPS